VTVKLDRCRSWTASLQRHIDGLFGQNFCIDELSVASSQYIPHKTPGELKDGDGIVRKGVRFPMLMAFSLSGRESPSIDEPQKTSRRYPG
jgi:hypothetical protein